jgi:predicted CoA-binding protein
MVLLKTIEEFLNNTDIAVIGASTNKKKYGYIVFNSLQKKLFNVFPVNPRLTDIEGINCFPDISKLPDHVKAAVFITKPEVTLEAVKQICEGNTIKYLWFQQGSENNEATDLAKKNGVKVVYGECILMFIKQPGFPHNMHRFFKSTFGKFPK